MNQLPLPWNFRIKSASDNRQKLYNARFFLCGNRQEPYREIDPHNLYAQVVEHETIGMFIARVAAQQLKV